MARSDEHLRARFFWVWRTVWLHSHPLYPESRRPWWWWWWWWWCVAGGTRCDDLEQQALRQSSAVRQVEGRLTDSASSPLVLAVLLGTQSSSRLHVQRRHARLVKLLVSDSRHSVNNDQTSLSCCCALLQLCLPVCVFITFLCQMKMWPVLYFAEVCTSLPGVRDLK